MNSSFDTAPSTGWDFPIGVGSEPSNVSSRTWHMPGAFQDEEVKPSSGESTKANAKPVNENAGSSARKQNCRTHWPPRTCRICFETVQPTFRAAVDNLPGMLQPTPHVAYESSDPETGRLISPCKCKGSSKYVHEGCLQQWRHADPSYGRRNFWQCPTCGFRYRLERMNWGRWISSAGAQAALTISIFVAALFVMGFLADPVINFYVEPSSLFLSPKSLGNKIEPLLTDDGTPSWAEHFLKGLASLGLLGFAKVLIGLSPWNWLNIRGSGFGGSRGRTTGRDRLANISWIVVPVGVGAFLWAVYKGVRAWSRRTLEKASERVMDVANDDGDDED